MTENNHHLTTRIEVVVNRLVSLQAGETVNFNPLGDYQPEEYITVLRKMLGERQETVDRQYHFKAFKDRVVVGWTPSKASTYAVFDRNTAPRMDWSSYIERALQLKDGESCDFVIPDDRDILKFKNSLATTLGQNSKETRQIRWGILHVKDSRTLTLTRYGQRTEVTAPVRPQNLPKPQSIPPIDLKPRVAPVSPYTLVIQNLEEREKTLREELSGIETAIRVLKDLTPA